MFPTFAKWGQKLTKSFETPAQRLGVEFSVAAPVDKSKVRGETGKFVDHWKVASGMDKGYTRDGREAKVGMLDPAVLKSLKRKADVANKWGTRGGGFVKDTAAVVQGKPRERDASGRKKKREWEKGWFKDTVKKGALIAGGIGYGIAYKKSPGLRGAHDGVVRTVKRKADDVRDAISNFGEVIGQRMAVNRFETPAMRILNFAKKKQEESGAVQAGVTGAAIGGVNGALIGGVSTAHSKQADDYFDMLKERGAKHAGGGVMVLPKEGKPFKEKGRFGKTERVARAQHETLKRAERGVKKVMRTRALVGGLGGAALLGGASYARGWPLRKGGGLTRGDGRYVERNYLSIWGYWFGRGCGGP
jgi:hypothetical protein